MRTARSVVCVMLLAVSHLVLADAPPATQPDEPSQPKRQGPLADLPSKPGPHVAKIRAMGDRSWLNLGGPKPDPRWGAAPGRAYTNKMTYAPDLVGAFLQGEGVHGAQGTGPRKGYFNDDVFFYDLMAHRYLCVYPGTNVTRPIEARIDANGFCAAEDGQNLPYAIAVHGYECQSYNPETGEFMTLYTGSPYSKGISRQLPVQGKSSLRGRGAGKHPYFYSTRSGRWERRKAEGPGPSTHFCRTLRYLPGRKQTLFFSRRSAGTLWFYDHADHRWQAVKPDGPPPEARHIEGTTAYDGKRDRLYLFNDGAETIPAIYDFKTNRYIDSRAKNQPYPPSNGYAKGIRRLSSTSAGAHYDSAADVVVMRLVIKQGAGDERNMGSRCVGLAIYDPETNEWQKEFVAIPRDASRKASWNSCYSPELNVHVYHLAGDSRTDGIVLLYRHQRHAERAGAD